jgi:uncharacterized repeat protein (TIGR01451 family)
MTRFPNRYALVASAAACLLLTGARPALAADTLELHNAVFQEVDVKAADGTMHKDRVPAAKVVPGTEVIYVITYRNVGKQPASDVVITNPIPEELAYRPEQGPGPNAAPEVSVDSGKTWGALASLSVTGDDGKPRPAQGSDVTHVRWKLAKPVKAGEEGSVSYRAVLE